MNCLNLFSCRVFLNRASYLRQSFVDVRTRQTCFTSTRWVSSQVDNLPTSVSAEKPPEKRKKTARIPQITLWQANNMTVTTLEEAKSLAKRRDLRLVRDDEPDPKTGRAIFRMLTPGQLLNKEKGTKEDRKTKSTKSVKDISLNARISDHDLSVKTKSIVKWVEKQHEVRVLIEGSAEKSTLERISKTIEQTAAGPEGPGKIMQKKTRGSSISFNIIARPPAEA